MISNANAGLSAHLAALELESEFEEEQFFEDEPDESRSASGLQLGQALADLGPVRLPEGAAAVDQFHAAANGCGDGVGNILIEVLQHGVNDAPEPARSETAIAGGLVDGNDAADFERLQFLLFVAGRLFGGIVQDLELRLHDLEAMAAAIAGFDFAIQSDQHAGAEFVLQIGGIEPDAFERIAALADGHFEQRHAAGAEESEGTDLGDDAGHLARTQLTDAARIEAIFVAEREMVEPQVFDRADSFLQQDLGEFGTDALDVLHVGREIKHGKDGSSRRTRFAFRCSLFARTRAADDIPEGIYRMY